MNLSTIKAAWFQFCDTFLDIENLTVIFSETSPGTRPVPKPYLSLRFIGPRAVPFRDDLRWNATKESFEVSGLREYTVSIQAFGADAADLLGQLQTKLNYPEVTQFFADHEAEIGIVDRGDVMNITELLDTEYEARAEIDVRFYTTSDGVETVPSAVGTIRKVEFEGDIEDGQEHVVDGTVDTN